MSFVGWEMKDNPAFSYSLSLVSFVSFVDRPFLSIEALHDPVQRIPFGRDTPELADARSELFGRKVFSGGRSGFPRDIFVHQGTAVIVGSGAQAALGYFARHLHPRYLNIVDPALQHQA